jgi:2,4-dienoyl-CoA reductase (NADPH2)
MKKARLGKADEINTCIGCNQACLDHIFQMMTASCLVNPFACRETEMVCTPATSIKRIAVVGAGPAGLSFSVTAAGRGHDVTLFDRQDRIGGQLNLAVRIPGKEEFHETLRYYKSQLDKFGVTVRLNTTVDAALLHQEAFDAIVVATGVVPRQIDFPGIDHSKVISYIDAVSGSKAIGKHVAIIGAGGIGFDTALLVTQEGTATSLNREAFFSEWGVDTEYREAGGLSTLVSEQELSGRCVTLLQRKGSKMGANLGKTTGWIHRATLKKRGVAMVNGVHYEKLDDQGLHIIKKEKRQTLPCDTVIICAGQEPLRELADALMEKEMAVHVIGGADKATELDAKRAIEQGTRLALEI